MGRARKPPTTRLGHAIRVQRGEQDLRSLAPKIGVSRATLSAVERGEYTLSVDTTRALATWLGWSADEVIAASEQPVDLEAKAQAPSVPPSRTAMHRMQHSLEETAREMGIGQAAIQRLVRSLHQGAVPSPDGTPTELAAAVAEKAGEQTMVEVSREIALSYTELWRVLQGVVVPGEDEAGRIAAWLGWTTDQVQEAAAVLTTSQVQDGPNAEP